ncbi:hypothetical protein MOC70_17525, partial [Bacillus vallismortis]
LAMVTLAIGIALTIAWKAPAHIKAST